MDKSIRFINQKIKSTGRNLLHNYPLIFFILCLFSYGLLIPFVGFYLDDWYLVWFKHVFGVIDFIKYFNLDRPLMSYFFLAANFILGGSERPIVWQLFGLVIRWLSVVALWQMLNTIWPNARRQNTLVALLAVVYPGFTQQWMSVIYCFFFSCLAGFFFSITLMLKAIRNPARFRLNYFASLLIMAYVIPASEFFAGLELIRYIILWFEFRQEGGRISRSIRKTVNYGLPFLLILFLFIAWRVFFFRSVNHSIVINNIFGSGFLNGISTNLVYFYKAIIVGTLKAWMNPFNTNYYPQKGFMATFIALLVVVAFFALFFWLKKIKGTSAEEETLGVWRRQAPLLATISLFFAVFPFWSSGLPFDTRFPNDRFLLGMLFGSCLLTVWLFEALGFNENKTMLLISLLVAMSLGYQVVNANFYKNLWNIQTRFLRQLNWRIPDLLPGTMIQTYQFPETEYWTGQALTAFLNWTYSDEINNRKIDYFYYIQNSGQKIPASGGANQPFKVDFRTYTFEGNTSQSIAVVFGTDGCLRVLDPRITPPETVFDNTATLISGAGNSDLSRILAGDGGHVPLQVVGREPDPDWCYFFEKAEFARQQQDYARVVKLYQESQDLGLLPFKPTEFYPFIESFARTGDWLMAQDLTLGLIPSDSPALHTGLCSLWKDLDTDFPDQVTIDQTLSQLDCQN